jgi:hypothetical protein
MLGTGPATKARDGSTNAVLQACGSLCKSIGPELAALVERLRDGSEEWQAANRVLATLSASQRRLEEAAGLHDEPPHTYDIGDDDDDFDAMSQTSPWSESHELREAGGAAYGDDGDGMGADFDGQAGDAAGDCGAEGWRRWRDDQWQSPQWRVDQYGRWHRASWADLWETEQRNGGDWGMGQQTGAAATSSAAVGAQAARRAGGPHDAETGEPSTKHRRQLPSGNGTSDGAVAEPALGAGTAAALAPHGADRDAAFARRVAEVVERAVGMGVQPISETGDELIMLSPELLSKWVSEHLDTRSGS